MKKPKVVNIAKTQYIRDNPDHVYIGRRNIHYSLPQSKWANPFKLSDGYSREDAIKKYRGYLIGILHELNRITSYDKNPDTWKENRLIQEVLPKIIIEESLEYDYMVSHIDSYRYSQSNHRSPMVAFAFKLELIKKTLGSSITSKHRFAEEAIESYYKREPKKLCLKNE
jgi:hypothetical protein